MIQLKCPLCHTELTQQQRQFICENGHSFDQAKEGYVNLLPVQHKKSKQPGDNKAMLQSRRRFLEAGYYQPLLLALQSIMASWNELDTALDVGAGEGFYSHHLFTSQPSTRWSAIDIAKPGMQMLAKRRYTEFAAVASAYDLPFANQQFDLALSIFSPLSVAETARVLKPKGTLVFVGPAPNHLQGLAQHIYDEVRPHKGNDIAIEGEIFTLEHQRLVEKDETIQGEHIADLLSMTPYYWSTSSEKQQQLATMAQLFTSLAFDIRVFRKRV